MTTRPAPLSDGPRRPDRHRLGDAAIRSIYRWQGRVEDEAEARVALHTRQSLVGVIVDRAHREHSYNVPCVIALPVVAGNPAYLDWVRAETQPGG